MLLYCDYELTSDVQELTTICATEVSNFNDYFTIRIKYPNSQKKASENILFL